MGRKCSHCGNIQHSSCCCSISSSVFSGGLKLFGVQLQIASPLPIKNNISMNCLTTSSPSLFSSSFSTSDHVCMDEFSEKISKGYLPDCLVGRTQQRKKGTPWTEDEHRAFIAGLEKQGKGDWRGISLNFVSTRTPTQVASHAQKYFLRQSKLNMKKGQPSLFDVVGTCDRKAHFSDSLKIRDHSCLNEAHGSFLTLKNQHCYQR